MNKQVLVTTLLLSAILAGCSKQPVIYPNDHYKAVGSEKAQLDIDDCIKMANDADAQGNLAEEVAKRTGTSAAIGGATGAVIGAISGSALKSGLIGAAAGGTAALVSGAFKGPEDSPVYRRFVELCLHEKGYQVLGWQ